MKLKSGFTGSILLLLIAAESFGQTDSIKNHFSVDLSIDYLKFASYLSDSQKKYEGELGIMFGRYRIAGEYGMAELTPKDLFDNADYYAKGNYWRIGFDFKLPVNPKNNLYIGARYAATEFDESILIYYDSNTFNPYFEENMGLKANWYEAVISSESRIIAQLYLGFKLRVRFMDSYDNPGLVEIYSIPGYGKSFDRSALAVNLFARYRITFW